MEKSGFCSGYILVWDLHLEPNFTMPVLFSFIIEGNITSACGAIYLKFPQICPRCNNIKWTSRMTQQCSSMTKWNWYYVNWSTFIIVGMYDFLLLVQWLWLHVSMQGTHVQSPCQKFRSHILQKNFLRWQQLMILIRDCSMFWHPYHRAPVGTTECLCTTVVNPQIWIKICHA